jgi:hypothetical protein
MAEHAKNIDTTMKTDLGQEAANLSQQFMKGMDVDAVKAELDTFRKQFDKVRGNVKDKAVVVDSHLHETPYPYLFGAFGLGVLAGGLLMKRR